MKKFENILDIVTVFFLFIDLMSDAGKNNSPLEDNIIWFLLSFKFLKIK